MLIESSCLSLQYHLFCVLYVLSPRWRCRTHKLWDRGTFWANFVVAKTDTIRSWFWLKCTWLKISELFQFLDSVVVFRVEPGKTRRRPQNGFVEWEFSSTFSLSSVCHSLDNMARFDFFSYSGNIVAADRERGLFFLEAYFSPF